MHFHNVKAKCMLRKVVICRGHGLSAAIKPIRCQTKVLLWRIHVSLGPKWKNPGSGVPSLMTADKPCPQLQLALI